RLAATCILLAGCMESPPVLQYTPPGAPGSVEIRTADEPKGKDAVDPKSVASMLQQAAAMANNNDIPRAIGILETALKREPKNRDAVRFLAALCFDFGNSLEPPKNGPPLHRAAELVRQLRDEHKDLNEPEKILLRDALYQEARISTYDGQSVQGLKSLTEAVEAGFSKAVLLHEDTIIAPLRNDPTFKDLEAKVETSAIAAAKLSAKIRLETNKPFEFGFSLPTTDGKTISLADYRGKVVMVDFWGTWCGPCIREIPHLIELSKKYEDKGLQVVGLTFERVPPEEVRIKIEDFVKEKKIPYPCLIANEKVTEQVKDFEGFPTTLFIDRAGKVRARVQGFDPEMVRELDELLVTLLAEGEPAAKK
ncbi:redoxin family protein, partial [Singulisphaera rosea]